MEYITITFFKEHYVKRNMKILIILLLVISLNGCNNSDLSSPEERVRAVLQAIELAAEERSLSKLMENISESYSDHKGHSKDDIRRLVQLHYIRNQNIHILSTVQSLSIEGNTATVELSTIMAATEEGVLNNDKRLRANSHNFSIVLIEDVSEQTWLVESVAWQRGWE